MCEHNAEINTVKYKDQVILMQVTKYPEPETPVYDMYTIYTKLDELTQFEKEIAQ